MTVYTKATLQSDSDTIKKVLPVAVSLQPEDIGGITTRSRRCFPGICLALLLLWLLIASFASGVLFYRYIYRRPTFYGWCGANLVENGHTERLEQQLEIDPEQLFERIDVPRFGINRPAVFVHDFRRNLTAIVDVLGNRCFIKELGRLVAPPKSFIDLVQKMESGYYENPRIVRETFRVGRRLSADELTELDSFMITRQCHGRISYFLQRASRSSQRWKRESTSTATLQFSAISGDAVEVDRIMF